MCVDSKQLFVRVRRPHQILLPFVEGSIHGSDDYTFPHFNPLLYEYPELVVIGPDEPVQAASDPDCPRVPGQGQIRGSEHRALEHSNRPCELIRQQPKLKNCN